MMNLIQQLSPIVKTLGAGMGAVLAVAYVAPLPTNTEGWVHYAAYLGLSFLGGVNLYKMTPPPKL